MSDQNQQTQQAVQHLNTTADRIEQAQRRQKRESDAAKGIAAPLAGSSSKPVRLPQSYWGDRQREGIEEMLTLLPITEAVVRTMPPIEPLPESATDEQRQQWTDYAINEQVTRLLKVHKTVAERLRKEI